MAFKIEPYGDDMKQVFKDGNYIGIFHQDPRTSKFACGFNGLFGYDFNSQEECIKYLDERFGHIK